MNTRTVTVEDDKELQILQIIMIKMVGDEAIRSMKSYQADQYNGATTLRRDTSYEHTSYEES